jgi:hypothetical protein
VNLPEIEPEVPRVPVLDYELNAEGKVVRVVLARGIERGLLAQLIEQGRAQGVDVLEAPEGFEPREHVTSGRALERERRFYNELASQWPTRSPNRAERRAAAKQRKRTGC